MAHISGVDLPREKRVKVGLVYVYGIDRASFSRILTTAGVSPDTRTRDLTDDEVRKLASIIAETQTIEGDLHREIAMNIRRLREAGRYRGIRRGKSLPVRGQKAETNVRACKGPRRVVANRKKRTLNEVFHEFNVNFIPQPAEEEHH